MRTNDELVNRINEIEDHLKLINSSIQDQVDRPFFDRQPEACLFLHVENRIYGAVLKELKWMLDE